MFKRLSSLFLGILLLLVFLATSMRFFSLPWLGIAILGLIVVSFFVNLKRVGLTWPQLLLPCFYLAGAGIIFAIIESTGLRVVFEFVAAAVFYLLEMDLGRESYFLQNSYLFSVFALYCGLFAAEFYFQVNFLVIGLIAFFLTYIIIIQGFAGFLIPVKKYFIFLISLVAAEIALGLALWPTFYIVNAVIMFFIFYLLWIFSFSAFFGKLTRNKIYWQLSLVLFVLLIILATASFRPI